jgi:hypothetical protein
MWKPSLEVAMKKIRFRSRDLRTRTKISLIFFLLLVPIGYTVWTIAADKRALIAASEREQIGSSYIAAVRPALFAVANLAKTADVHAAVETAWATQKKIGESRGLLALADDFAFAIEIATAGTDTSAIDAAMEKGAAVVARGGRIEYVGRSRTRELLSWQRREHQIAADSR